MERTAQTGIPQQNVVVQQVAPEAPPQPDPTLLQTPVAERQVVTSVEPSTRPERSRPEPRPFILEWLLPLLLLGVLAGAAAAAFVPGLFGGSRPQIANTNPTTPISSAANSITNPKQALDLGLREARARRYTEAIAAYNRAIQLDPNLAAAYINRGRARHQLGDLDNAISDYTRASEISTNSGERLLALSNRSHSYYVKEDYVRAEADAQTVLRTNPLMPEALINRASAQVKLANNNPQVYTSALNDYNRAIQEAGRRNPVDKNLLATAYNNRGNLRLQQQLPAQAIADYNLALKNLPNYADALYNRGLANATQGNVAQAEKDLNQAADFYGQQGNTTMQKTARAEAAKVLQRTTTPSPR
jgi:tetratricopeptide (TPR) repeat protein